MCWSATGRRTCVLGAPFPPPPPPRARARTKHTRPGLTSRAAGNQKRRRTRGSSAAWRQGRCCWRSARAPLQPARPLAWRAGARRGARRCQPQRTAGLCSRPARRCCRRCCRRTRARRPARAARTGQAASSCLSGVTSGRSRDAAAPLRRCSGPGRSGARCARRAGQAGVPAGGRPRLSLDNCGFAVSGSAQAAKLSTNASRRRTPGRLQQGVCRSARARALHPLPQAAKVVVARPWDAARLALGAAQTGRRAAGSRERSAAHAGGRACPGRRADRHGVRCRRGRTAAGVAMHDPSRAGTVCGAGRGGLVPRQHSGV